MDRSLLQCLISLLTITHYIEGQSDGDLRLVDNSGLTGGTTGRLEVYYNSEWGTVCADGFGPTAAVIACRQLGYSNSERFGFVTSLNLVQGTQRIWLDDLHCDGFEIRLELCSHSAFGSHNCGHNQDVGLSCTAPSQGDVRLIGVSGQIGGMAGRVDMFYNNQWRTICHRLVAKEEADIICRQLGFSESVYYGNVTRLGYPPGSSLSILHSINCAGFESRLEFCIISTSTCCCPHSLDTAVICTGTSSSLTPQSQPSQGDLRLNTEGDSQPRSFSGRLEIYFSGQWGTVCDDGFDQNAAHTACRQLGFVSALDYGTVGYIGFSQGSGPIWLNDLGCSSDLASHLLECDHSTLAFGSQDCAHREDIALVCTGVGSLRLVGAPRSTSVFHSSGRLEVYANGSWGTVCDDGFGSNNADVACRQLGFPRATRYGTVDSFSGYTTSLVPILLDDLSTSCSSSDNFLLLCLSRNIGDHDCTHSEDVELSCSTATTSLAIGLGVAIPLVVIVAVVIVCCCCCCCYQKNKTKPTANHTTRIDNPVQASAPQLQATAYPMQPVSQQVPSHYPVQPGYVAPQNVHYSHPGAQYPAQQFTAPYPSAPYTAPQQLPTPYPTSRLSYTAPQQLPAPYPTSQPPPAQYVSGQPTSVAYPAQGQSGPQEKSNLYSDAPPTYADATAPPPSIPINDQQQPGPQCYKLV